VTEPPLLVRRSGRLGRLTVNRPRQLNALTPEVIEGVTAAVQEWDADPSVAAILLSGAGDRALCAGADVRLIREAVLGRDPLGRTGVGILADEYRMNRVLARCRTPIVALQDGFTLGGGLGLSGHVRLRVATERARVGMPETAIGLYPDVGALHLLARSPGETGTHAALSGAQFGPADAIGLGLSDVHLPSGSIDALVAELEAGVVPTPDWFPAAPPGRLAAMRSWVDSCYATDDLEELLAALRGHDDPEARATADHLGAMSPTSLAVTLLAIRRVRERSLTLEQVLEQDLRICGHLFTEGDFVEGVRAKLVDKDGTPRWSPATVAEVDTAALARWFEEDAA
jgi:enoyl-CoA hydratase